MPETRRRARAAGPVATLSLLAALLPLTGTAAAEVPADSPDRQVPAESAAPAVSHDTGAGPGEPAVVQYTDAPRDPIRVTAQDVDSPGTALTARATGLPAGLDLAVAGTSEEGATPGLRTWQVTGQASALPGEYPVTVEVADAEGNTGRTELTVRVVPEDARVSFLPYARPPYVVERRSGTPTGSGSTSLARGAGDADLVLRARVYDVAATRAAQEPGADQTVGDIGSATVTFVDRETGAVLCAGRVEPAEPGLGYTACRAFAERPDHGRTLQVGMVVSGGYTRDDRGDDGRQDVRGRYDEPETWLMGLRTLHERVLSETFGFSLHSDDPEATFLCRLNGVPYACPEAGLNFSRLQAGFYRLRVAAVSPVGVVDATPTGAAWLIPHDDRELDRGKGWSRQQSRHAFRGSQLVSRTRGAVLRMPLVDATWVAPVISYGRHFGRFAVTLDGERIARYPKAGSSFAAGPVQLPGVSFDKPVSGMLRVVTLGAGPVKIDGLSIRTAGRDR